MQKLLYVYRALQKLRHFLGISVQLCCACPFFLSCGGLHLHDVCGPSSPSSSISAISPPAASSPYIFLPHTTISQEKRRHRAEPWGEGCKISSWETNLDASPPLLPLLSLPLPLSLWMVHSGIEKVLSTLFSLLLSLSLPFSAAADAFPFLFPDS